MMSDTHKTIYFAAPLCVRESDRYETMFYLLSHRFPEARILEARTLFPTFATWKAGWQTTLPTFDELIFMRNDERAIGRGTYREIREAHKAGKAVFLARMNKHGALVLVPYERLIFSLSPNNRRNYAMVNYLSGYRRELGAALDIEPVPVTPNVRQG